MAPIVGTPESLYSGYRFHRRTIVVSRFVPLILPPPSAARGPVPQPAVPFPGPTSVRFGKEILSTVSKESRTDLGGVFRPGPVTPIAGGEGLQGREFLAALSRELL